MQAEDDAHDLAELRRLYDLAERSHSYWDGVVKNLCARIKNAEEWTGRELGDDLAGVLRSLRG